MTLRDKAPGQTLMKKMLISLTLPLGEKSEIGNMKYVPLFCFHICFTNISIGPITPGLLNLVNFHDSLNVSPIP